MKKIFTKLMLLAVAATALASCQNDGINDETITPGVEVTVNATTSDISRSVFGDYNATDNTYPTVWSGNESWKVAIGDTDTDVNNDKIAFSDDRKAAIASFSIKEPDVAESYVLYAVSPKTAYVSSQNTYIRFGIPSSQKPIDGSCDEAAQVLLAVSKPKESLSSFDINFEHATAYCKLSFLNIGVNDEVEGVSISAKDVKLAGRYEYTVATKAIKEQSSLADVISLETTNTTDLYFACAPVDISGKELTFTIHTDKGNLSKTVAMPENRVFKSGVVASLGIDMSGIGYPVATTRWERVTSLDDITDGEYVIVDGTSVLTNGAVSSAPAQIALNTKATVGDNVLTIVDESVIWTFTGSSDAMTIRSYANTANYLYANSGNNGVRIGTTSDTWAFQEHGDGFAMKDANNNRYCGLWEANLGTSNPDWRSYNTVDAANYGNDGACLTLYKKFSTEPVIVVASKIEVDEFGAESATVNYDVKHMEDNVTTSTSDWITASASNKTLTYSVESNYTRAARTGEIVLTCGGVTKTIVVSQAADKFSVSATEIQLGAEKDATATFTVTSSYEYSVSSADEAKFIVEKGENNDITVTALSANDTTEPINLGSVVVSRSVDETTLSVDVSQKGKSATGGETITTEVVDVLNRTLTGATSTSYIEWSGKTSNSTAVYKGNSAGGNDAIQLRSDKSTSGIVTTTSGGKVRKITVVWNSNTSSGRTLDIYGKNTAYSAATDLYSSSTQGTKLGSIKYGTSTALTISGDYEYIGLRSNSGAMYITDIQITWETGDGGGETPEPEPATPVLSINLTTLSFEAAAGSKTITCTIENEVSGQNVTATESVDWLSTSVSGKTVTITATANTGAERTAEVTIAYAGAESKIVTVSQAEGNTGGGEAQSVTCNFTSSTMQANANAYSNSWNNISDGVTFKVTNANNNNKGWSYIRVGAKKTTDNISTVSTASTLGFGVKTVTVSCEMLRGSGTITVYVASDAAFTTAVQTTSAAIATSDIVLTVPTPTANMYYKVEFKCTNTTNSNGVANIKKIVYSN